MLGKLMKYEFKSTARTFLPLYGALIILGIFNRIFYYNKTVPAAVILDNWLMRMIAGITTFVYGLLIMAVIVITLIVTIQRFQKNLMGDEGYLMFTLPVPTWMLTTSKMLAAAAWAVASTLATIVSSCIMAADMAGIRNFFANFGRHWSYAASELGLSTAAFTLEMIVVVIVALFSGILPIYFAISLGQLWQKHRNLGAFGAYIATGIVTQILYTIMVSVYMEVVDFGYFRDSFGMAVEHANTLVILCIALAALICGGCFVGTNLLLKNKLNLE